MSSHGAQVSQNQTKAIVTRLAKSQEKFRSQPQRMSAVKLMTLIKEWGPIVWDGDVGEDSIESEDFEPSYFQGFFFLSHLRK